MAWNTLPDNFRDPSLCSRCVRRGLKTELFTRYEISVFRAVEMLYDIALCKSNVGIDIDIGSLTMPAIATDVTVMWSVCDHKPLLESCFSCSVLGLPFTTSGKINRKYYEFLHRGHF